MTFDVFTDNQLEQLCDILGETSSGLTGSQIGKLLRECNIDDPGAGITKRVRLYEALRVKQQRDRSGNNVVAFIQKVMDPVRYTGRNDEFEGKRQDLNLILAFCGYAIGEDGKFRVKEAAKTLSEAEERAGKLKAELRRRGVHHDVLDFCRAELLQENYFHAVLEATKSVATKIRNISGLKSDGAELVDQAFGSGKVGMPFIAFNSQQTETEKSEHSGMMNLMKGMFGAFRNTTAHAPKVYWAISEQDALDLLTIASLLHRRLDGAIRTPRTE